ncbi:hypothetical protein D0Z03_002926 [Geotrichum reessii]|nr:hypothetical protein D0Z03_002926 [Galactomyces reessii]
MGCGMSTEADLEVGQNSQKTNQINNSNTYGSRPDMTNARARWIKARNDQIESGLNLARNRAVAANSVKLLLLGAGESGKSTVLKQMRLIHGTGFTEQELTQYARVIWSDAVQSMRILISSADRLGITLDSHDPDNLLYGYRQLITQTDPVRMYKEDLIALDQSSSHIRKNSVVSTGSANLTLKNNNFLEDYVLKYDRRKFNSPTYEFTGSTDKPGIGKNPPDADITTTLDFPHSQVGAVETPQSTSFSTTSKQYYNDNTSADVEEGLLHNEPLSTTGGGGGSSDTSTKKLASKHDVAVAISELWNHDRGIAAVFARSNEFQLEVNASHYFTHILAYSKPGYRVTEQDILLGRIKTTGISETVFRIKNRTFRVFDVGGQRSERRKWIHCFDDVTALIFVAAVSEYDEVLFEDEWTNRMHESLSLFESICQSRWFHATPIILFLNKIDILRRKLERRAGPGNPINYSTVATYFPDYVGDPHDYNQVIAYFKNLFLEKNLNKARNVYVQCTLATDTTKMKFVIAAVTDSIIQKTLVDSGIL